MTKTALSQALADALLSNSQLRRLLAKPSSSVTQMLEETDRQLLAMEQIRDLLEMREHGPLRTIHDIRKVVDAALKGRSRRLAEARKRMAEVLEGGKPQP